MRGLRLKLVQMLLISSTLPLIVLAAVTFLIMGRMALYETNERIKNNLTIAESVRNNFIEDFRYVVRDQNRRISALMEDDQYDLMRNEYAKIVAEKAFDFFVVTDQFGRTMVSLPYAKLEGRDMSRDIFVRKALRSEMTVSTEIMNEEELSKFGLLQKAVIPGTEEVEGMVLRCTMPVINRNEIIIGTLSAGYLLNNNNSIPVRITGATGLLSTLFLKDLRISSTVPSEGSVLPVGTRLEPRVIERVIGQKQNFLGEVRIGSRSYLAIYEPIYDHARKVIGVLGIGMEESKVFHLRDSLLKVFSVAVVVSILFSFFFGVLKGAGIVKSIRKLHRGIEAFGRGDYAHRLEIRSDDEIEDLAGFFNQTMDQIVEARKELQDYARNVQSLRSQVTESTAHLEAVEKQLLECERLAAMGRMAAALSHELRNIFMEIATTTYTLKNKVCKGQKNAEEYFKTIESGLSHANDILTKVLKFSFPKKLVYSDVDINYLLEDILELSMVQDQMKKNNVRLSRDMASGLPRIHVDGLQVREALSNIVFNAIQAMPEGGTLSVSTENDQGMLRIHISDTGIGMSSQTLAKLFTPFSTTKARGLGLGLCITKAIIEEHSGHIQVHSELEKGTRFTVSIPVRNPAV